MPKQILVKAEEIKQVIPIAPGRQLALTRPLVMGILNVTPDSFSDGSKYNSVDKAVERALEMETEGADIIDIGGESSRPGSEPVSEKQELERIIPVMKALKKHLKVPISVDTYKANVAKVSLEEGAEIINDISALRFDRQMAPLAAEKKVPVILMHMLGTPRDMQKNPTYKNCIQEINDFFENRIDFCIEMGIDKSKIIIDPGIGFGKRLSDNIEIIAKLGEFKKNNRPIMVGVSRKSFIGMISPESNDPARRLGGSIAAAVVSVLNGADIVRVHDVAETVEALKIYQAVKK